MDIGPVPQPGSPDRETGRRHEVLNLLIVLAVGGAALAFVWTSDYQLRIFSVMGLGIVAACGLNLLTGVTGQISLGHAGFYAVGAYTTALLTVRWGWPVLATIPVGLVLTALLGVLLAWPSLRLKGPYLTIVTIAFGLIIYSGAVDFVDLTNGPQGVFPIPPVSIFGYVLGLQGLNVLLLGVVAVAIYVHSTLINSRYGRAMRAVRGNEIAAASLGINVVGTKCFAFAVSGVFAGLAGMLFAPLNGFVNPDSFTLDLSVQILLVVILGGSGTIWGPVAGVFVLTLLDRALAQFGDIRLIAYGAILLAALYVVPDGVAGLFRRVRFRSRSNGGPLQKKTDAASNSSGAEAAFNSARSDALEVHSLGKAFGGLQAVSDVSFSVRPGSIQGIVGPNGAGKTTLLNMISGVTPLSTGHVRLGRFELGGRPVHRVAAAGVARTFQNLALFSDMTVLENVMVGQHLTNHISLGAALLRLPKTLQRERLLQAQALSLLNFVGLAEVAHNLAGNLPQGHQRLLEIARALALHPSLLLLDEPAAGLNATEVSRLIELLRRIGRNGITVVLIEHHMQLVMAVCERIVVLDFGRLIAEGTPELVRSHPKVLEAYLGKPRADSVTTAGRTHAKD